MIKKLLLVTLAVGAIFISLQSKVLADDDPCNNPDQQQACDDYINQTQKALNDARGQEKTLQSQLNLIDTQTKLTTSKIEETNFEIAKLEQEIGDLSGRITRISGSVDSLSQVLLDRIVETYKYGNVTPVDLIFSSNGFSDLLERLKYTEVIQANDKKVLYQLQATKTAYHDQQQDRQTRQQQETKLQADLKTYQQDLTTQKTAKDQLLRITQNNESVYQQKIEAALAEQQAILSILSGGGNEVQNGQVSKGDAIGNMILGASACSSGTHLHFEVHQNNQLRNPSNFLSNKSVAFDNSPDSPFSFTGSWDWPISDPIRIEQGFGNTWWAQHGWYSNPPGHTGIDMFSSSSLAVHAIHDGTLYQGGIACGGGTLHYKRVDHGDGTSSLYLHVI